MGQRCISRGSLRASGRAKTTAALMAGMLHVWMSLCGTVHEEKGQGQMAESQNRRIICVGKDI